MNRQQISPTSVKIGAYKLTGKRLRDKRRHSQAAPNTHNKVRNSTFTWCNYCKKITHDCDPVIKYANKVYHFFITEFARTLAVRFEEATSKNVKLALIYALHVCKANEIVDVLTSTETHIICNEAGTMDTTIGLEIKHVGNDTNYINITPNDTIIKMTYNGIGASISVDKSLYYLGA